MHPSARLSALLATLAAPLAAQETLPGNPAEGAELYGLYCATCHGLDGQGDGPTAAVLTLRPTDLTGLAARNAGTFPVARVVARIDGRDPLVSHGSPMPVWGDYFDGTDAPLKAETGQPIFTSQPIVDLVTYLAMLQE